MNEYRIKDICIGQTESFTVKITEDMLDYFLKITGDINPMHIDESYAKLCGGA